MQERPLENEDRGSLLETLRFFGSFIRQPGRIGSICPSSRALANAMIEGFRLEHAKAVVELGPGTGAFTGIICERLNRSAMFLALELHPAHVAALRRRFPRVHVQQDSAEKIAEHLAHHGLASADYVVSGLPWANMSPDVQRRILIPVAQALSPEGAFVSFAYVHARRFRTALRFRSLLKELFSEVRESAVVWGNLPPAFVYRCRAPHRAAAAR